ncbi:pyruvate, water dikinase regulatory protein [Acuticoccus mangrovi]|uniref:Putative pyruvate, phosphate dikinase regulatory protein n=1 Tax=Acuticoccus mangrovi TaxID=2796142 RepID=A0A934IJG1_9HYPH|nr:pyruvate, water dikinase regulatory protein [Acuticoccus mangrovi]MBJ3777814.1 kinase/pyrophosphorylase [Acuticoccus mangrovi]
MSRKRTFVHVHLVSDSTGETLMTASRAAVARYDEVEAIEHVYPLVRSDRQLDRVLAEIEDAPGIVMFTLVDGEILARLQSTCGRLGLPCIDVLDPLVAVFQSYLNVQKASRVGAQHELDAGYFRRIAALDFAMRHDDGALPDDIDEADVVLIGVSRTSKTPTSIYLANRGVRATNLPIVPGFSPPPSMFQAKRALIVGLTASPERIVALRENRLIAMNADRRASSYVNRQEVAKEVTFARKLCAENGWPLIDVTRRSIEETAAAIVALLADRRYGTGVTEAF